MATDQEFRDLEAVVATLRRDLRESQDTINLWRQNGLGHLDSGSGKWRFGGNVMQLDNHGMQVATGGTDTYGMFIVQDLVPNPAALTAYSRFGGQTGDDSSLAKIASLAPGALAVITTTATTTLAQIELLATMNAGAALTVSDDGTLTYVALEGQLRLPSDISPAQIVANTDNYAPAGIGGATVLRLSTDASRDITGITGGVDGRILIVLNVGSFNIVLKDDVTSTAANRFQLNGDVTIGANEGALLWYDATDSRWRLAAKYAAGGGAGDVATDTLWDALGDLAVGTGANTANNLPVGTDGYVLTADSTDLSFGIKWAPAAGGPGGSTSIARTLMLMGA